MSKRSSRNKKGGDGNVPNFVFKLGDNTSGFGSTPSSPSGSVTGFTFSNPSSPATAGFSNFGTLQRGQSEINPKPESSPLRRTTSDIGLNTQSAFTFGQQSSTQSSFGATLQRQDSTASLNSQSSFSAPATINNGLNTSGTAGNAPGAFGFAAPSTTTSAPASAISFGAPSTTPTTTTASSFTTPAFTFGTSATSTAASTAATSTSSAPAFTFGAPSSTTTTSTTSTSTPVSAFSFGTPSTTTTPAATTAPTTAFSFGTPSTTTTSAATTAPTNAFSFGAPSTTTTSTPTTAFSFGTTSTATSTTATTSTQAPSFTFGTPASSTTSTQKSTTTPASTGFSFGTPSTTATSSTASTTATTSAATISFGTTATSKPTSSPFTFGTPSSTATSTPATSTSISFGTTDKKSTAETTSSKPADTKLSFGTADKKEDNKSTVTSSPFTFGTSTAATATTTPAAPAKPNQFSFVKVLEDLEKAAISQVPNQFHATLIGPALIQQTVHHTSFRIDNIMPTTRFTELPEQAQKELDELEKYIRLENQRNEYIKNHKIPRYFDTISQSKKSIDLLSQELDAFSNTLKCTKESIEFLYDTVKEQLRHANDGSIVLEACKHPGNNARWLFGYTEEDDYFLQLSKQLSNRLEEYKKCIWEIERTAESWTQNKKQSPQDIANIMRTQNEAFMALSNKVAALHESVNAEKNNYNQYLRMYN